MPEPVITSAWICSSLVSHVGHATRQAADGRTRWGGPIGLMISYAPGSERQVRRRGQVGLQGTAPSATAREGLGDAQGLSSDA